MFKFPGAGSVGLYLVYGGDSTNVSVAVGKRTVTVLDMEETLYRDRRKN